MFIQKKYSVVNYLKDNGKSDRTALVTVTQIHTLPLLPEKSRDSFLISILMLICDEDGAFEIRESYCWLLTQSTVFTEKIIPHILNKARVVPH